jgi:hypothetical protein
MAGSLLGLMRRRQRARGRGIRIYQALVWTNHITRLRRYHKSCSGLQNMQCDLDYTAARLFPASFEPHKTTIISQIDTSPAFNHYHYHHFDLPYASLNKMSPAMYNPYAKKARTDSGIIFSGNTPRLQLPASNTVVRPPATTLAITIMPQSQWRKGSIQKCKESVSKFKVNTGKKSHQTSIVPGEEAWDPEKKCPICRVHANNEKVELELAKAVSLGLPSAAIKSKIPHRKHHYKCALNTKTKGMLSKRSVEVLDFARNAIANNNTPPVIGGMGSVPTQNIEDCFKKQAAVSNCFKKQAATSDALTTETLESYRSTPMATELRVELERRLGQPDSSKKMQACRAPLGAALLIEYIDSKFSYARPKGQNLPGTEKFIDKYQNYRQFFKPGSILFTFPEERRDKVPLAGYHSIEGSSYLHVDWSMSHPDTMLTCPECQDGELIRDRWEFQKNKTLLPIVTQDGTTMWANIMKYICKNCLARCSANDGRLLASLPHDVSRCYPVKPKYAGSSSEIDRTFFQLSVEVSEDLEDNILTYANANVFSRKIWNRKLREHGRRLKDFFSICSNETHGAYPSVYEFCGSFFAPSADQLYDLLHRAERSELTPTGVSEYDRHRREIMGVGCEDLFAIDWTFAVLSNYLLKEKGAKACFTLCNEHGQVATANIVETTKVAEIAHAAK